MKRPAVKTTPSDLEISPADASSQFPSPAVAGDAVEKRWQIDRASGVPAPVIRANMISLRLSYQGRIKVAFFEQD